MVCNDIWQILVTNICGTHLIHVDVSQNASISPVEPTHILFTLRCFLLIILNCFFFHVSKNLLQPLLLTCCLSNWSSFYFMSNWNILRLYKKLISISTGVQMKSFCIVIISLPFNKTNNFLGQPILLEKKGLCEQKYCCNWHLW